jgi:hypothetical protein
MMLHGAKHLLELVNNPPLPSLIATLMSEKFGHLD